MADGDLKDGTARAHKGGTGGAVAGVSSGDLNRGYSGVSVERTPRFDDEADGGTNEVGNPVTRGGFAGRPLGWAR